MMKTLILNPPWSTEGFYGVRAGSRWPHLECCALTDYMPFPFFMAYAAAVLERAGLPVAVIDACAERLDNGTCLDRISAVAPDLIVMEASTPTINVDLEFASAIKNRLPDTILAATGTHTSMLEPVFLQEHKQVDIVFRGEYEMLLLELVNALSSAGDLDGIKGLVHRSADGMIRDNGPRPLLMDIDTLPWPARHLFPMELYKDQPGGIPLPSLQLWASRGCPYQCVFCVWPQLMYGGNQYRTRNPVDVVDELEYCLKTWPFKSFYFDDDTFNVGKRRILTLCKEIKSRGVSLPWAVMARADLVDREMLVAMKEAGLVSLKFGMESGVQELIDASGKKLRIEQVEKALKETKELGIEAHLTLTFGLPGETKDTIKQTIRKAIELDPYSVQFSITTPFPGTAYHQLLKEKGQIVSSRWEDYSGSIGAVHRTDELSKEDLDEALEEAYKVWNLHLRSSRASVPSLLMEAVRHPVNAMKGIVRLMKYEIRLR